MSDPELLRRERTQSSVSAADAATLADDGEEVSGGIRVSVRIRPLNERELNENQTISWECTETSLKCESQKGHKVIVWEGLEERKEGKKEGRGCGPPSIPTTIQRICFESPTMHTRQTAPLLFHCRPLPSTTCSLTRAQTRKCIWLSPSHSWPRCVCG